jgi:hypothetical protein
MMYCSIHRLVPIHCPELSWNFVVGRAWVLWWFPVWRSKTRLSIEDSSSFPVVARKHILPFFHWAVLVFVGRRPRCQFDLREALSVRIDFGVFSVTVLTELDLPIVLLKVNGLVSCRSRRISIGLLFHQVDSLRTDGILLVHYCVYAFIVLNRALVTCPGPGLAWIWGMR